MTKRINFLKGELPGPMATEWWTQKDWDEHDDYVKELKRTGEYLKPDFVDVSYNPDDFKMFQPPPEDPNKPWFSNFGILIPSEKITFQQHNFPNPSILKGIIDDQKHTD